MYGIYANIGGILMGSMLPYIAYMDPMGVYICVCVRAMELHTTECNAQQPPLPVVLLH